MPIRPEFLVRGLDGRPQPPLELQALFEQYNNNHPDERRVGLFYTNASWAITEIWRADDPRLLRIQQGDMQAEMAFDICGYLPVTCSLDEALPYIQRELRHHTLASFAALREKALQQNEAVADAALENAVLGAVSNDMTAGGVVSGAGIISVPESITPGIGATDRMAAARAAKAAKAAKAEAQSA